MDLEAEEIQDQEPSAVRDFIAEGRRARKHALVQEKGELTQMETHSQDNQPTFMNAAFIHSQGKTLTSSPLKGPISVLLYRGDLSNIRTSGTQTDHSISSAPSSSGFLGFGQLRQKQNGLVGATEKLNLCWNSPTFLWPALPRWEWARLSSSQVLIECLCSIR